MTHIDHDHQSGIVRGLLCKTCNIGLGNFKDSIVLLHLASQYLTESKTKDVYAVKITASI